MERKSEFTRLNPVREHSTTTYIMSKRVCKKRHNKLTAFQF